MDLLDHTDRSPILPQKSKESLKFPNPFSIPFYQTALQALEPSIHGFSASKSLQRNPNNGWLESRPEE